MDRDLANAQDLVRMLRDLSSKKPIKLSTYNTEWVICTYGAGISHDYFGPTLFDAVLNAHRVFLGLAQ